MPERNERLLAIRDLSVRFDTRLGRVTAVRNVSFDIAEGQCIGLVGESGSGKSVTSLAILGLVPPPGAITAGRILFGTEDLLRASPERIRRLRGASVSMIFQDPMTSLNPFLTIGQQLGEVLEHKQGLTKRESRTAAALGLGDVGIPAPETTLRTYPHELSGGMRQRVMIAMALLCRPKLLIADEPTTALDVTIQAQILELLRDLQERHGMAILLITHDLGVVAGMAERLLVMYAGSVVEEGPTNELFEQPSHPYTVGLLSAIPRLDHDPALRLPTVPGQPPDLSTLSRGCAFALRCPYREARCEREYPPLERVPGSESRAACFAQEQVRTGIAPPHGRLAPKTEG